MKDLLFFFVFFLLLIFILSPENIQTEVVVHLKATWNLLIYKKVLP